MFGLYSIITGYEAYWLLVEVNVLVCARSTSGEGGDGGVQTPRLVQVPHPMIFPFPNG